MQFHHLARFLLCAVLAAAFSIPPHATAAQAKGPPNIVMIISDDQAWTDYSFMGHPNIQTPNLDRLAAESRLFARGYVPASLCCPSLASMITGRYPHQHKVTSNDPPMPAGVKPGEFQKSAAFRDGRETMNQFMEATPTLPRLLTKAGYLTLQTGKWWQGHFSRGGFTHGMTKGGRHGDEGLDIGRKTMQPITDFIQTAQREKKPFFVWYAPMLPHTPHNPPARLFDKYKTKTSSPHVARYWAMVEWFDETCGELLDTLDKQGVADNTIVVYVTDNGWIQDPDAPKYAAKSKQSQYDGGLRTPIMVRWPGKVKPARAPQLATSLDFMPTLLKAAGVPAPADLPGIDLLDDAAVARRDTVFGAIFTHNAVDLHKPASSLRWRWMIEGDWKLIVPAAQNEPKAVVELFRITEDSGEEKNLATTEAQRVEQLRKKLDAWWPAAQ
ncbi:sulfatase [Verrucomicrobiota bacterium]|nr:sulfatase [Verrucomicrobiota bacterium]